MDARCVSIIFHHSGAFSKEGDLTYEGGQISIIRDVDKDLMSYFHVVELAKKVGYKDGDSLYYLIPGRSKKFCPVMCQV
uniref:PB1-like domain-containing protein n=1 Tax=Arundo donax TaxID=35708 RepID=A0A0A9AAN5_ARUDO